MTNERKLQLIDLVAVIIGMGDLTVSDVPNDVSKLLKLVVRDARTISMFIVRFQAKLERYGTRSKEIEDGIGQQLLDLPLWAEFEDTTINERICLGAD